MKPAERRLLRYWGYLVAFASLSVIDGIVTHVALHFNAAHATMPVFADAFSLSPALFWFLKVCFTGLAFCILAEMVEDKWAWFLVLFGIVAYVLFVLYGVSAIFLWAAA